MRILFLEDEPTIRDVLTEYMKINEDYVGNDRIIDAHVKNLRKKMPVDCIKTVIGVGYQFREE